MKKLFLTLALTSLVVAASAQDYSKKEVRDQLRTERQQATAQQNSAAIKAQNYTFAATYMTPQFSPQIPLNPVTSFVAVYPNYLEVNLPYKQVAMADSNVPDQITINTNRYLTYENQETNGVWTVVFQAEWGGVKYVFHIRYNANSGAAIMTIVPNMGDSVSYTGTIQAN